MGQNRNSYPFLCFVVVVIWDDTVTTEVLHSHLISYYVILYTRKLRCLFMYAVTGWEV